MHVWVKLSNYKDVRIVTKLRQSRDSLIDQHISYREAVNAILNTLGINASAFYSKLDGSKGLPCCHDFLIVTLISHRKLTPISPLHAEKRAEAVFSLCILKKHFQRSSLAKMYVIAIYLFQMFKTRD